MREMGVRGVTAPDLEVLQPVTDFEFSEPVSIEKILKEDDLHPEHIPRLWQVKRNLDKKFERPVDLFVEANRVNEFFRASDQFPKKMKQLSVQLGEVIVVKVEDDEHKFRLLSNESEEEQKVFFLDYIG